jgi:hypothetical protein
VHEHTGKIAVLEEILEDVQYLGVKQGGLRELARGRGASQHKDARSNNGTNAERRERPGAKRLLEPVFWVL